MTPEKKFVERRQLRRYKVKQGAFAAMMPVSNKLGQIVDLGKGGLAFLYIHIDNGNNEGAELDIFVSNKEFYLPKLPVRQVSDVLVPNKIPNNPIVIRRRGVQFKELTSEQTSELDAFIQRYTTEEK